MTSKTVQTAEAVRFIADLGQNKWMAGQWQKLLDDSKAKVGDKQGQDATNILKPCFEAMSNFLAEQGYDCTAAAVLDYLKSDLYQTYLGLVKLDDKPTSNDARAFVQQLLTKPDLTKAWQTLVGQVAKGQATGDDLNAFMSGKGFTCNYMQVNAAFQEMRDHNIAYWAGSYRTTLTGQDGRTRAGPIVVVSTPSSAAAMAELNLGQDLVNSTTAGIKYINGVLTWRPHTITWDPTNHFGAKCSGSLTFSAITQSSASASAQFARVDGGPPPATPPRHVFTGTLTYFDGMGKATGEVETLNGWLDVVSESDPTVPPGAAKKNSQFPAWVNYLLNGLMVVQMLHSFLGKKKNLKDDVAGEDQPYADKAEGAGDAVETDAAADTVVSPFEDASTLEGSTLVKGLKAEQEGFGGPSDQQVDEAIKGDAEFDEAREGAGDLEGEGWGSDFGELGELGGLAEMA